MVKNFSSREERAKVKFRVEFERVIEFELEGSNAAVENSVRTLAHALSQKNGLATQKQAPPLLQTGTLPIAINAKAEEEISVDDFDGDSEEVSNTDSASVRVRTPRKTRTPEVVNMELTSGDKPFKEYCEGKDLSTDRNKYLACAAWAKEHHNLPTITDAHIYTMFRFMKWRAPGDIGSPLRAMKKEGWFNTPEQGKYGINHLGENLVNEMGAAE